MKLDDRIAAAIRLGTDHVRTMSIPPMMAQECARRWLLDEARDHERAIARAAEQAAEDADRVRRHAVEHERERVKRASLAWAKERGGFHNDYDWRKFNDWVDGRNDEAIWVRMYDAVQYDRNLTSESYAKSDARHWSSLSEIIRDGVDDIIEERAASLDMHWSAALLTTTVSMPDGARVPWGEATVEQHQARIDMLAQHAATELATASRHRAAVIAIEATPGAQCLNDLASVAA